ncbi:MAG TPA: PQQ-dependent sugar dehydrogenase, partial [Gemmataceae bacterium]
MRSTTRPVGGMLFLAAAATGLWLARAGDEPALPGGAERVPWTTSRITGSPDPPPPYRVERAFGHLSFKNPLLITHLPGSGRLFVGEQAGRIYSFPNDPACKKPDLFIDLDAELKSIDRAKSPGVAALYGLAFHPKFAENRYCYICYVLKPPRGGPELPDGTRVSRFKVTDTDPPRCDPASEQVLLTFLAGGHNGGCLKFGPDGYLYISTGDATSPNPPDALDTGQDLTDLLSSILRIDVDRHENGKPYAVPADNPFVRTPGVRPEIWAYGFRNPWKMSFDRVTGELWAGDVGWELWEMVYRVEKGGNYGWPVVEGRQPVKPEGKRGPTPILPPTLEYPHTEAASITGGFVYRGKRLPDLYGAYVCGDYVTRKLWAAKFEEGRLLWHKEIAQSNVQIVAFGEDEAGELYFLDYVEDGGIYRLEPNPIDPDKLPRFPRKLSETGLFASVAEHRVAPGVYPFAVNAEQWMDHATAERFVALPGTTTARFHEHPRDLPGSTFRGRVHFPKDGVLVKTIALETEAGNPASRRRLETQVLHFDGDNWRGYSYRWNDEQTDAELVPADGAEQTFAVRDPSAPGGVREQTWHFHARAECLRCHNPWADYGLAFTLPQLDRPAAGAATADQLDALRRLKLIELPEKWDRTRNPRLTDPRAVAADLGARARSYLHVNCAHCHQFGAGGSADIDLHFARPLDQTKT